MVHEALVAFRVLGVSPLLDLKDVGVAVPTAQHDTVVVEVDNGVDRAQRAIAVRARGPAGKANDVIFDEERRPEFRDGVATACVSRLRICR
jgi:hypothetical protein